MTDPTSTPANKTNSPEEQASPEPQNSRCTTPQGSRQHLHQAQDHLPRNDTSMTDSEAAEVEEGEVASSDISDTEVPQNSRCTTPLGSRPGSPTPYSRGQRPYQHHPHNDTSETDSEAAEVEEGEAATDSEAAEVEEGESASSDISDPELGQKEGGRR